MAITSQQLILSRVLRELQSATRVGLGEGLPQLARPHLDDRVEIIEAGRNGDSAPQLSVVEALQVSRGGSIVLAHPEDAALLSADRCLVATLHCDAEGEPRLVAECNRPADCDGCVSLVVTELGVIEVNKVGFELRELAPGVASDDVRARVRASLHVSDAISNMQL